MQLNKQMDNQTLNENQGYDYGEEKSEEEIIDNILAELEGYIKDPSKVTVETLSEIRDQLMNLKESMGGGMGDTGMNKDESKSKPLSVMISMMGGKHK